MRFLTLLLCLLTAPLAAAPPKKPRLPAGLYVASIKIESHNVFDTDVPPENKLLYKAANRAHIRTRDAVIERELLFSVGEHFDPLLLEETERNLRALPFIRRAEVSAVVNKQGSVDVTVRTFDAWTLEVVAGYKRAGGVTNVKGGFAEHNILGQGKSASAVYSKDGDSVSRAFDYKDRQFLRRKRLQFALAAAAAPGSRAYSIGVDRPFYASIARTAFGGGFTYSEGRLAEVTRRTGELGGSFGVALATSTKRTRRVTLGLATRRSISDGPVPDVEQLTFFRLGGEWQELDFITARRIQNFTRDEDFNLGLGVFPSVAWAPRSPALGSASSQILPRVDVTKGVAWESQLLLLRSGYRSKYVNGNNGGRVASFEASHFARGLRYQTWAFHAALDLGWQLRDGEQLGLGELNGLRGYGLNRFTGSRRFLYNIEDRVYVWDNLLRVLDVGAVAFYDSGYVWPEGSSINLADLRSSVGLGLRAAPSRSGGNSPVRVDLAFPVSRRTSFSSWSLSILAGQAF
ncbi:MAG: BamA/TamA family outer membrane protein [Elusimicrobiota bacterium]|nr:BamA/TamA family outer membrane protein [Elusimicrobiota bacterium]